MNGDRQFNLGRHDFALLRWNEFSAFLLNVQMGVCVWLINQEIDWYLHVADLFIRWKIAISKKHVFVITTQSACFKIATTDVTQTQTAAVYCQC